MQIDCPNITCITMETNNTHYTGILQLKQRFGFKHATPLSIVPTMPLSSPQVSIVPTMPLSSPQVSIVPTMPLSSPQVSIVSTMPLSSPQVSIVSTMPLSSPQVSIVSTMPLSHKGAGLHIYANYTNYTQWYNLHTV